MPTQTTTHGGTTPSEVISISSVERILLAVTVAALGVFIAMGDMQLCLIALVVLAVCLLMMVFRGDRVARRREIKNDPHQAWAEYRQPAKSAVWASIAIFFGVYLIAVGINLFVNVSSVPLTIGLALFGMVEIVAVYFLPVFNREELLNSAEGPLSEKEANVALS